MKSSEIILSLPTPTDIPDVYCVESPVTEKRRKARLPAISNKIYDESRCWNSAQRDLSAEESPLYNETEARVADIDEFATLPDFEGV